MILFAGIVFFFSLTLIVLLFVVKMREEKTARIMLPAWRHALDDEARHIKDLLHAAELDLRKIAPIANYWVHVSIHVAALEFARAAHAASHSAHRLADFVSHKRTYERAMTRSEFLKKVQERKNATSAQRSQRSNGQNDVRA